MSLATEKESGQYHGRVCAYPGCDRYVANVFWFGGKPYGSEHIHKVAGLDIKTLRKNRIIRRGSTEINERKLREEMPRLQRVEAAKNATVCPTCGGEIDDFYKETHGECYECVLKRRQA